MFQIPLSGPKGQGQYALVDDDDYAAVSVYTWNFSHGYAVTTIDKIVFLHHLILGDPPAGLLVDHKDRNGLNNQRANLRFATKSQNAHNMAPRQGTSSPFKGVSWDNRLKLWSANINANKIRHHLGLFVSEFDAARAYNAAAAQYHGEYARPNIIPDDATEPTRYRQAVPFPHNRTSKYRGVSFARDKNRWTAAISVKNKTIHLGHFGTEEEAARVYDTAAKLHHGNRAFLNFPD